jgi:hypothetical protein
MVITTDNAAGTHAMTDKLGTRRVYLPQGRNPLETLVDAIATSPADLFAQGSSILWLKDTGELVGVGRGALLELISKYVVTKQLVQHGDRWRVEYHPHVPDEMTLRALLKEDSGLAQRLPKAPSEPVRLTPQQQREVRDRLAIGEPKTQLASAYKVDVATIEQLAR